MLWDTLAFQLVGVFSYVALKFSQDFKNDVTLLTK